MDTFLHWMNLATVCVYHLITVGPPCFWLSHIFAHTVVIARRNNKVLKIDLSISNLLRYKKFFSEKSAGAPGHCSKKMLRAIYHHNERGAWYIEC